MENKKEKGLRGEKIASDILKKMGFRQIWDKLDDDNWASSYDILAIRLTQKYAINVKFGDVFSTHPGNLIRLNKVYENHNFKPAYLFIQSPEIFWFYSLDTSFPQKLDEINQKLEIYQ